MGFGWETNFPTGSMSWLLWSWLVYYPVVTSGPEKGGRPHNISEMSLAVDFVENSELGMSVRSDDFHVEN